MGAEECSECDALFGPNSVWRPLEKKPTSPPFVVRLKEKPRPPVDLERNGREPEAIVAPNIRWGVAYIAIWLCLVVAAVPLAFLSPQSFGLFFFLPMVVFPYNENAWLNLYQWLTVALLFGLLTRRVPRWPRFWLAGFTVLIVTILIDVILAAVGAKMPAPHL